MTLKVDGSTVRGTPPPHIPLSSPGLSRRSRLKKLRAGGKFNNSIREFPIARRKQYYVYILASRPGGAIYIGVTNDLIPRVYEHKNGLVPGFTKRYGIDQLVYFEVFDTTYNAIQREKNIKHWPRAWKTQLIARENPTWRDLYEEIV